ncbi:MAG: hypothetical protein P0120_03180 [Nitrospira sp.]|nr:hypothetical protein [Nitrospira sp.]
MQVAMRVICLLIAISLLPGCTLWDVMTFSSDANSYAIHNSQAQLVVFEGSDMTKCDDLDKQEGAGFAAAAPMIAAGAVAVFNYAASELSSYLSKKKKEFSFQYNTKVNLPEFYLKDRGSKQYTKPAYNCLRLIRIIDDKTTDSSSANKKTKRAFVWRAALIPNESGTALKIDTIDTKLSLAGARTDSASRKIDVSVEIKIDATTYNKQGDIVTTTIADKTLSYPGMTTPELNKEATFVASTVESSWFPPIPRSDAEIQKCEAIHSSGGECRGVSAITISALVTETGSGGDDFGTLGKQIDDNKKTLADALSTTITNALKPPASSGSSK